MVKIRLSRAGAKGKAFFRVVATDSRSPRDGRFIELLGSYDPRTDPPAVRLDRDRVAHWLDKGAQPSQTLHQLLKRYDRERASAEVEAAS